MRVVGGRLRGRKLLPIRGSAIRPTADRVREAVFNIIAPEIRGAQVLDLFAGTGAMGIEALSRGASSAIFIDTRKASLAVVRRNIDLLGLGNQSRVILWDAARNLNCLRTGTPEIDLVFMDPPYHRDLATPALAHLARCGALMPGALIVVEHADSDPLPEQTMPYVLTDLRRYGKTFVSLLIYDMNAES